MKYYAPIPKFYRPFFSSLRSELYGWWIGVHPPFAQCLDCDTRGLLGVKFATLMPGRLVGHPLTGYGTCIKCFEEQINTQPEPEKTCSICDGLHTGYCPVEDDGRF